MSLFDDLARCIARYRIRLERDADGGVVPRGAVTSVEECYRALCRVLESARVELEGADLPAAAAGELADHFARGYGQLVHEMYVSAYRVREAGKLAGHAARIRAEAKRMERQLWALLQPEHPGGNLGVGARRNLAEPESARHGLRLRRASGTPLSACCGRR